MINYEDVREPIYIFTSPEARFQPQGRYWYYRFVGGDTLDGKGDSGYSELCDCPDCKSLGDELGEFFAIYEALKVAMETKPNEGFELCYGSANFVAYFQRDGASPNDFRCRLLSDLVTGINHLMKLLNVELTHYTYSNKDCIPMI